MIILFFQNDNSIIPPQSQVQQSQVQQSWGINNSSILSIEQQHSLQQSQAWNNSNQYRHDYNDTWLSPSKTKQTSQQIQANLLNNNNDKNVFDDFLNKLRN